MNRWLVLLLSATSVAAAQSEAPLLHLEIGGHTDYVQWSGFAPDGDTLFTAGYDQVVRLWDVRDPLKPVLKRAIRIDDAQAEPIESFQYFGEISPDGRISVSAYVEHLLYSVAVANEKSRQFPVGSPALLILVP